MISLINSIISSVISASITGFTSATKPLEPIARLGIKLLLCLGFVCANFYISPGMSMAVSFPQVANVQTTNQPITIAQTPTQTLDVDRAADKADQASENIYEGLDTTKRIIGKTDKRNQIIEEARDHASQKWKSLADKAKAVQNSDASLTPTEEQVLKQVED